MGVPALFRWLSKKYPKIVSRVIEDVPTKVKNADGEIVEVPMRYEGKNPNGFECDNLYLDMNGIVHPCTHPEGRPAPETEEEMMVEVFKYTERVVNMARPRKVLMMAIDGVAPRAKMNQQRSRRFRAAQEAADKEIERQESIRLFEAMGHPVSDETRNQKGWDTNAITPGTPFMDFLSISLKYWISHKLATEPGWRDLKIIISDSSVPGEGEHKIMDWIRRQRSYPDWDANTSHVIYGLDADLIMLALATHEPHFKVLREDVFFQGDKGRKACRNCGAEDHFSANCLSEKQVAVKDPNVVEEAKPVDPKPFIFLNVSTLREYLAVELAVPSIPFPFDLELAIDDWIFMIFFVGNDFLPHLPSLEIREGAIDMLLKIWKEELGRMGGYLTNHGKVNMGRAQTILEGLAKREDDVFQQRKIDEERQDATQKRRRAEDHAKQRSRHARESMSGTQTPTGAPGQPGSMQLNGTDYVAVTNPADTARGGSKHPSLPSRPAFDIVPKDEIPKKKGPKLSKSEFEAAALKAGDHFAEGQSGDDRVANRQAARMANIDAAAKLRAELAGEVYVPPKREEVVDAVEEEVKEEVAESDAVMAEAKEEEEDGAPRGTKRAREDDGVEADEKADGATAEGGEGAEGDAPAEVPKKKLKFNPDGTVDGYVDDVQLWEPGYRERYYRNKFGVELTDKEFVAQITKCYIEGLCWVLEYYYQGVPAWDWYYPYHYAPFAQDFENVGDLKIVFEAAEPFKPYGQLLGVFPAASRSHLPEPLQTLMIDDDSPIIDFYPDSFEIDMNGKKMQWQGVALLPFIDQHRLLSALASKEGDLTEDEKRRNRWGDNIMFIGEENKLYEPFCALYGLKAGTKPAPLDTLFSDGVSGSVLGIAHYVPNSVFETPLPNTPECPDITHNTALSARYFFPRQAHKHMSVLLPKYRPLPPALNESDRDWVRRGGGDGRGPGGGRGGRGGRHGQGQAHTGGPGVAGGRFNGPQGGGRYGGGGGDSRGPPAHAQQSPYGAPPPPRDPYGYAPPVQARNAYGGGSYSGAAYGGGAYGGAGAGGGAYGGSAYGGEAYAAPANGGLLSSHPLYWFADPTDPPGGNGGYGGGSRNPYGYAPPPPNPYAAPPAARGRGPSNGANPYGAPPAGGYGGQGQGQGYGGSGYGGGGGGAYGYGGGRR